MGLSPNSTTRKSDRFLALVGTAAGHVPGDTLQRAVTLTNATGNQALAGIALTTLATTASKLDTAPVLGLQLTIDSCSVPWTPHPPSAA